MSLFIFNLLSFFAIIFIVVFWFIYEVIIANIFMYGSLFDNVDFGVDPYFESKKDE